MQIHIIKCMVDGKGMPTRVEVFCTRKQAETRALQLRDEVVSKASPQTKSSRIEDFQNSFGYMEINVRKKADLLRLCNVILNPEDYMLKQLNGSADCKSSDKADFPKHDDTESSHQILENVQVEDLKNVWAGFGETENVDSWEYEEPIFSEWEAHR